MKTYNSYPRSFTLLILLQGIFFLSNGFALDFPKPESADIEKFVTSKLPKHFSYKTLSIENEKESGRLLNIHVKATITVSDHLYLDATSEVLTDLSDAKKYDVTPPMILKKMHGSGEIIELPLKVTYRMTPTGWRENEVLDEGQFAEMGLPKDGFPFSSVIFGSTQARRALSQYEKEMKNAKKDAEKKPRPVRHAKSDVEPQQNEMDSVATPPAAEPQDEESASLPVVSEKEKFRKLEEGFYTVGKSKTKLKSLEKKLENLLDDKNDDSLKSLRENSRDDLALLADNYKAAMESATFERDTTNFRFRSMCESYVEAYKSVIRGDYNGARSNMSAAQTKRHEVQDTLLGKKDY